MNVKEEKIHFPVLKSSTWAGLKTRLQKTSYQAKSVTSQFVLTYYNFLLRVFIYRNVQHRYKEIN